MLELEVTEVRRLNRAGSPCEEAEGYSLVRCVEEFVAADVGCKSPWDRFEDAGGGRKVGGKDRDGLTNSAVKVVVKIRKSKTTYNFQEISNRGIENSQLLHKFLEV